MKIPEHVAFSFLLAQFGLQQSYGPGGTVLAIAAGCLPDLDGVAIVAGWRFYRRYHRIIGHGLPMTLIGPVLLALLGSEVLGLDPVVPLWCWLQAALLFHLLTDGLFYRWPVQVLWPASTRGWGVGLLGWNDLVPTLALYGGVAVALSWKGAATWAAAASFALLGLYLCWRAVQPQPRTRLAEWLAGGWAVESRPVWRWLTGDFIT